MQPNKCKRSPRAGTGIRGTLIHILTSPIKLWRWKLQYAGKGPSEDSRWPCACFLIILKFTWILLSWFIGPCFSHVLHLLWLTLLLPFLWGSLNPEGWGLRETSWLVCITRSLLCLWIKCNYGFLHMFPSNTVGSLWWCLNKTLIYKYSRISPFSLWPHLQWISKSSPPIFLPWIHPIVPLSNRSSPSLGMHR